MKFKPGDLCIDFIAANGYDYNSRKISMQEAQGMIISIVGRAATVLTGDPPRLRTVNLQHLVHLEEFQQ